AVQRAQVLGDEPAILAACDTHVMGCHVRVVHHHVVVERPPDARGLAVDADARRDLAVARQHFDPDRGKVHDPDPGDAGGWNAIASRNRFPSATALACETPCIASWARRASRSRSWVSAISVTL